MTILTKPSAGSKLNPKAINSASVEGGAIIEPVRKFYIIVNKLRSI